MKTNTIAFVALLATLSGCAYRTSSNLDYEAAKLVQPGPEIIISEGDLQGKKYKTIAVIEVSVKKLTVFHSDPTKEQANKELIEKAKLIGADAVINVKYDSGIGFTTWGYIDAKGTGVKLLD
jgi:hypothetical protein